MRFSVSYSLVTLFLLPTRSQELVVGSDTSLKNILNPEPRTFNHHPALRATLFKEEGLIEAESAFLFFLICYCRKISRFARNDDSDKAFL